MHKFMYFLLSSPRDRIPLFASIALALHRRSKLNKRRMALLYEILNLEYSAIVKLSLTIALNLVFGAAVSLVSNRSQWPTDRVWLTGL